MGSKYDSILANFSSYMRIGCHATMNVKVNIKVAVFEGER